MCLGADLSTATLRGIYWPTLLGCPASLPTGWHCVNLNLLGVEVRLRGANLAGADLSGFDIQGSEFRDSDLTGANLAGADLHQTRYYNTICPDGTNSAGNAGTCCGHHVGVPPAACDYNP